MPETFVTGGTGFIGGALLDRLLADGRSVRALVRSHTDATALETRGVDVVVGDLATDLVGAMEGCATVFHVAGLNAMCLHDPGALDRVNVAGTRSVVAAAARAGVRRVVYTSSAATIGEPVGVAGSESTPHRGSYNTAYERSKHLAEIAAFNDARRLGVDLVAVNPSSVQGPGRTGGTAKILVGYLNGSLRFVVDTRMSIVFIDDVVRAHLAAETRGVAGERYLVSGWSATVGEAIEVFARITGVERSVRYLPPVVLAGAARLVAAGAWLFRRDAPLCPEMVRALRHGHTYDASRIEREWGFEYTPPEKWLAQTVEWYRNRSDELTTDH